jgi:hypothetical protein
MNKIRPVTRPYQTRILFLILASHKHIDRLQAVIDTWVQEIEPPHYYRIIGDEKLAEQFKNVLICTKAEDDHYDRLPRKMVAAFRLVLEDNNWDFMIKVDDDTFAVPNRIVMMLRNYKPKESHYIGHSIGWGYAQGGGGYILTRPALRTIESEFDMIGRGRFEDWQVGVACRKKGIKIENRNNRLEGFGRGRGIELIIDRKFCTCHYVTPKEMHNIMGRI